MDSLLQEHCSLARDHSFFIAGNYKNLDSRLCGGNTPFNSDDRIVLPFIEEQTAPLHAAANFFADKRQVFADAAAKDHCIGSVQCRQ